MYNDYYLEQINNKLNTTNGYLEDIIDNQQSIINNEATIIENQEELISGDNQIISQLTIANNSLILLAIIILWILLYKFIERCLR